MSRSGYVDDLEDNILNLYRGRVTRALRGKRGQTFLREMAAAMDAMPEKILIHGELIDAEGDCCAIGTVCKARGLDVSGIDVEDAESIGNLVNIAKCMAAEIEYVNDESGRYDETPEQRWQRIRKWIDENLAK